MCAVLGDIRGPTAVQAGHHGLPGGHRQDPAGGTAPTVRPLLWTSTGPWLPLCRTCAKTHRALISNTHHHLHHHLSLNREGRLGTTDDFTTNFLHFPLFSTALWNLVNSMPVHSLVLSCL